MEVKYIPFSELLASIVDNRGKTCPTSETGIPLIATNCIRNDLLYPAYDKVRYVSQNTFDIWFRGHPMPGDFIFVTKGTPGRVCLAPNPVNFCIAQDMVAVRVDESKVDPKYLFALLRSNKVQRLIEQLHVGSLIPHFKKGDFDKLLLPVPNRSLQNAIGSIYFQFSRKIELNLRMNKTLEEISRAIFNSWFADLNSSPADARQVTSLGEHVEIMRGLSYKGEGLSRDGMPLHNLNSVYEGGGYKFEGIKYYTGEFKERHLVRPGDLIVTNTEQGFDYLLIGYPALVPRRFGESGLFSHHLFHVTPRNGSPLTRHFLYYLLMTPFVRDQVVSCTNGTTVNMLSPDGLKMARFALPAAELIQKFNYIAASIHRLIECNTETSETLVILRDEVLSKLMSGAIRLEEAQEIAQVYS
jgi:type I restriction enzyme, S subunit